MARPTKPSNELTGNNQSPSEKEEMSRNEQDFNSQFIDIEVNKNSVPKELKSKQQKKLYKTLKKVLAPSNLKDSDIPNLVNMVLEYDLYLRAVENVNEKGEVIEEKGSRGQIKLVINPWISIRKDALKNYNSIANRYATNPSMRSQLARELSSISEEEKSFKSLFGDDEDE